MRPAIHLSAVLQHGGRILIAMGMWLARPTTRGANALRDGQRAAADREKHAAGAEEEIDPVALGIDPEIWDSYRREGAPADWLARVARQSPGYLRSPGRAAGQRSVRQPEAGAARLGMPARHEAIPLVPATRPPRPETHRAAGVAEPVTSGTEAASNSEAIDRSGRAGGVGDRAVRSKRVFMPHARLAGAAAAPVSPASVVARARARTMDHVEEGARTVTDDDEPAAVPDRLHRDAETGAARLAPELSRSTDEGFNEADGHAPQADCNARANDGMRDQLVAGRLDRPSMPVGSGSLPDAAAKAHRPLLERPGPERELSRGRRASMDDPAHDATLRPSALAHVCGEDAFARDMRCAQSVRHDRTAHTAPDANENAARGSGAGRFGRATAMRVPDDVSHARWPELPRDSTNERDPWRRARREASVIRSLDAEQREVAWNALRF